MRLILAVWLGVLWGCFVQPQQPTPVPTASVSPSVEAVPTATPVPLASVMLWAGHPEQEGYADGPRQSARFYYPKSLTIDAQNNLYVGDLYRIRKISPQGQVSTIAGKENTKRQFEDAPALEAGLLHVAAILSLANGDLLFYDGSFRKLTKNNQVTTFLAIGLPENYIGPQPPTFPVREPSACVGVGLGLGKDEQLYSFAGSQICRIDANNQLTPVVGKIYDFYKQPKEVIFDGPAQQAIISPIDMVFDSRGYAYISDFDNHVIRQVSPDWSTIITVAGDGKKCQEGYTQYLKCYGKGETLGFGCTQGCSVGYRDGPAQQAQFYYPSGLVIDSLNNLYIADGGNNRIRKLSPDGIVSTVAEVPKPGDMVRDSQGNFYVSSGYAIYKFRLP